MKIVYIVHQFYPYFSSGTERFVFQLSSMLQKNGNKVKIITYHVGENPDQQEPIRQREYLYQNLPVLEFHLKKEPIGFTIDLFEPGLLDFASGILKKENPDVVHLCHPMRCGAFLKAAQDLNIPTLVTVTDLMFLCPKVIMRTMDGELCPSADGGVRCNKVCPDTGKHNQDRMQTAHQLLKKAGAVVAPSEFLKGMIAREIPDLNIQVIHHGLNMKSTRQTAKYHGKSKLIIGFVGSILEHKGLHLLIDAIKRMRTPNLTLKVYGDDSNPYAQKLKKDCKSDSRIVFCGLFTPEQTDDIYAGIDVLAVPSICYESYSLVKYEALVRGIPVIVADLGALPEGIQDGINSFLFDLNNKDSLKNVLQRLISHPEKLNPVKKKISSFPITYLEQEAFQYLTLYRKLR